MFVRVKPQQARHLDGYTVQVGSRESVEYIESDFKVEIVSDMLCSIIPLYVDRLKVSRSGSDALPLTSQDKKRILERVKEGLEFLEIQYKVTVDL